ncbi:unannotated protein [freshwater metagenome]|uniref:Unannotated protein n=1 Tax=freshwater metagenome TaxID=449393 RepID=A0A6J6HMF0_9ZZZZ
MHDQRVVREQLGALFVETKPIAVFADTGNERFGHALALHTEQVTDIDCRQHRIDVSTDLDRPSIETWRQKSWWSDESDIGTESRERCNVASGNTRVANVADDCNSLSGNIAEALANCVAIKQRLRGVLVPTVASVDHCACRPLRYLARDTRRCVTNNNRVDAHRFDGFDGVAQRFALLDRRGADAEVHGVGRKPLRCSFEAKSSSSGIFEEERNDRATAKCGHLRNGSFADLNKRIGERHDFVDAGSDIGAKVGDRKKIAHATVARVGHRPAHLTISPRSTPSAVTSTASSRLVGRFLPTKSGRIGSSR